MASSHVSLQRVLIQNVLWKNIRANFIHINPTIYIFFCSLTSVFSTFCMRLMVSFKRYQSIFGSVGKCLRHFSSNPVYTPTRDQRSPRHRPRMHSSWRRRTTASSITAQVLGSTVDYEYCVQYRYTSTGTYVPVRTGTYRYTCTSTGI